MYEHSIVEGVHYYDVGIGGDTLRGPEEGVVNDRQIFIAHDHAPEHWNGNVLEAGGKHYGHVEVDVRRKEATDHKGDAANAPPAKFAVTITPVYVFPILDPKETGEIVAWERREYDDILTFDAGESRPEPTAPGVPTPKEMVP
jgi:hypothetical protein